MAIPAATSINAIAAEQLRAMFAASSTFQSETGGAGLAADHVYFESIPDPMAGGVYPFPVIAIGFTEDYRQRLIAGGGQNQLRPSGTLTYSLMRKTPAAYIDNNAAAVMDFWNFAGGVLDDVAEMAADDDNLSIVEISNIDTFEADAKYWDTLGKFWIANGLVFWGDAFAGRT